MSPLPYRRIRHKMGSIFLIYLEKYINFGFSYKAFSEELLDVQHIDLSNTLAFLSPCHVNVSLIQLSYSLVQ